MTVPPPPQRGQGCDMAKIPWLTFTLPRPWHCGQVMALVPGAAPLPRHTSQSTVWGTLILVVTPLSASSKESFTETLMSSPRSGARCRRPPDPPPWPKPPPP